jgi:hypothetical protein
VSTEGETQTGRPCPRRRRHGKFRADPSRLLLLVAIGIFTALAGARSCVWETTHDEGATFFHAVNPHLPRRVIPIFPPRRIRDLAAVLDPAPDFTPPRIVQTMALAGIHPPAYYVLLRGWTGVFGTRRGALRLPGICLGVLSVLGAWMLAGQVIPWAGGRNATALLLAGSAAHLQLCLYLRPYGLATALAVWSTWLLLRIRQAGSARAEWILWGCFTGLSALGVATLYHYGFVLLWQGLLWVLLVLCTPRGPRAPDFLKLALAAVAVTLIYAPWLPSLVAHLENTRGRWYFGGVLPFSVWPGQLVQKLWKLAAGTLVVPEPAKGLLCFGAAVSLLPAGILLARRGAEAVDGPTRVFWLSVPLLPLLMLLADFLHDTHTFFVTKTTFFLVPLLWLAVALSAAGIRTRAVRVGLLAASLAMVREDFRRTTDYGRVVEFVSDHDEDSHVLVLSSVHTGFSYSFLVKLREVGVTSVRVVSKMRFNPVRVVDTLLIDPTVKRVTLVDFESDVPIYPVGFPEGRDEEALDLARSRGQTAWAGPPSELSGGLAAEAQVVLVRDVRAHYASF